LEQSSGDRERPPQGGLSVQVVSALDFCHGNWDDFAEKAKKLQVEAEKLSTTSPSDGDALRSQRAVAFACDGCHETYRVPKEK
jgi:cytochrome c556